MTRDSVRARLIPGAMLVLATAACGGLDTSTFEDSEITVNKTADVSGVVKDAADGAPVRGATVTVADRSATTSSAGQFYISGVRAGQQTLSVQHDDYQPFSIEIELEPGSNAVGTLELDRIGVDAGARDAAGYDANADDAVRQDSASPDAGGDDSAVDAAGVNDAATGDAGLDDRAAPDTARDDAAAPDAGGDGGGQDQDAAVVECNGSAASLSIAAGAFTWDRDVTLRLGCQGAVWVQVSEDRNFVAAQSRAFAAEIDFELSAGDGPKTVWGRFAGADGRFGAALSASITLDTEDPSPPVATLPEDWSARGVDDNDCEVYTTSEPAFTVEITTPSTDENFSHHEVYVYRWTGSESQQQDGISGDGTRFGFDLPEQGTWWLIVRGVDLAENWSQSPRCIAIVWDTEVPVVQTQEVAPEATAAWLTLVLDEPASCVLEYGLDQGYSESVDFAVDFALWSGEGYTTRDDVFSNDAPLRFALPTDGVTYHYRLTCADFTGNSYTTADATFQAGWALGGEITQAELVIGPARSPTFVVSDVLLHGDLSVEAGAVLRRERDLYPGTVRVEGDLFVGAGAWVEHCTLEVGGRIEATGTAEAPVRFDSTDLEPYGYSVDLSLDHVDLDGGLGAYISYFGHRLRGAIRIRDSVVRDQWGGLLQLICEGECALERNAFLDSYNYHVAKQASGSVVFRHNLFSNDYNHQCYLTSEGEAFTAEYNTFLKPDARAVCLSGSGDLVAPNNYWGTTDPSQIAERIWDRNDDLLHLSHEVAFDPPLAAPDPATPTMPD